MKKELDEKLCKKYPKIFVDRNESMQKTAMCWGFDCGDGWYWLIDRLCSDLQWNTDNNNSKRKYPQITAVQVKEKFGGLRFYTQGASEAQYAVISFAETLSEYMCEKCGSTKDVGQTRGWITTLCKECAIDNLDWKQFSENDEKQLNLL